MSLRMVMSLTPDLAHEMADGDTSLVLGPAVGSRAHVPEPRAPRNDAVMVGRASDRIEAAIEEMQDFLSVMHPTTDAEALQSLRLAFPTVPLTERIAAIQTRFFA